MENNKINWTVTPVTNEPDCTTVIAFMRLNGYSDSTFELPLIVKVKVVEPLALYDVKHTIDSTINYIIDSCIVWHYVSTMYTKIHSEHTHTGEVFLKIMMNALPSRLIPTLQFNLCHIDDNNKLLVPTRLNTVFLVNGQQHAIHVGITEELKQRIREIYDMVYNEAVLCTIEKMKRSVYSDVQNPDHLLESAPDADDHIDFISCGDVYLE